MDISMIIGLGGASGPVAPAGATFAVAAHPSCCTTDTAGGTPCGDGDAIRWWQELVSGVWYEQATSGARLIMRDAGGGKWYAEGATGRRHDFAPATVPQPLTLGAAVRFVTAPGLMSAVDAVGTQTGSPNDLRLSAVNLTGTAGYRIFTGTNLTGGTLDAADHRLVGVYNGASSRIRLDGSQIAAGNAGTNGMGGARLGANFQGLLPLDGRLYAVVAYASALDAAGLTALDAWLAGFLA